MQNTKKDIVSKDTLKAFSLGDHEAFQAIFELMEPRLYSFVLSYTKSSYIAEEIVQEVFIRIWERREGIRLSGSFSSLLYTTAKNLTLNYLRNASQRAVIREELWKNLTEFSGDAEAELIFSEYHEILEEIVDHLPSKKRSIYRMSREEGKSNAEIADILEISPKTVKNNLWQIVETIRMQLQPHLENTIKILLVFSLSRFFW
ncbi:RNA polymerase sigma factor [Sinomicrobium soli]|uniref:RNA polymerase sigma factor n=1 Tax=Sinomicrobium sp. N-1-3-6 TaxID=2219864 RepID=UPI000DCD719F|nr:RNA polymerase sigma-70 factor [Sinomicrobium sp. N-1-3-6]RAV30552.1 hypothetical protein DN748_03385 [Sinomicrobium sp. N-1-3-6]